MACCVKPCCFIGYGCGVYRLISDSILGVRSGTPVTQGPLREHVDRVATAMGIKKPISLVESRDPTMLAKITLKTPRGNSIPWLGRASLAFVTKDATPWTPSQENTIKFHLTRQIAQIKTNQDLLGRLVALVVAVATTIFLFPTLPITSWLIGAFAGIVVGGLFTDWNDQKVAALAAQYSTPEEREAGVNASQTQPSESEGSASARKET